MTPPAMSASGATAATITKAGVIRACAPLINPPIPDAFFGIPAAFITSSTCGPKSSRLEANAVTENAPIARSTRRRRRANNTGYLLLVVSVPAHGGPRIQRYSLAVKKPRPEARPPKAAGSAGFRTLEHRSIGASAALTSWRFLSREGGRPRVRDPGDHLVAKAVVSSTTMD